MGAALFKRGWGCQIELPPRTTVPRGRLPGRWRSRCLRTSEWLHVRACACVRMCACIGARIHVRALYLLHEGVFN